MQYFGVGYVLSHIWWPAPVGVHKTVKSLVGTSGALALHTELWLDVVDIDERNKTAPQLVKPEPRSACGSTKRSKNHNNHIFLPGCSSRNMHKTGFHQFNQVIVTRLKCRTRLTDCVLLSVMVTLWCNYIGAKAKAKILFDLCCYPI